MQGDVLNLFARRAGALLCAPRSGGLRPPQSPWGGRSAPPPRVTFPSRGKSPKARQGLRPLESPGAWSPPFSRSLRCAPSRAGLPSATKIDRFATLGLWANRSCFPPQVLPGSHPLFSIRGLAGMPPRMPQVLILPQPIPLGQGAGESKGVRPLVPGGPGTRRSLAYLCLLSLREKVGRGRRGGEPSPGECRGAAPLAKGPASRGAAGKRH